MSEVGKMNLWLFIVVAIAGAVLPVIGDRFYSGGVMRFTYVVGPIAFVTSTVCAYYVSGRSRKVLFLLFLAPIAFFRLLEGFLIMLSFALATHP